MRTLAIILFAASANGAANEQPIKKSTEAQATAAVASQELTVQSTAPSAPGPAATDTKPLLKEPLAERATPAFEVDLDKSPLLHVAELLNVMGAGPVTLAPDTKGMTITAHGVFTGPQFLEIVAVQLASQNASVVANGKGFILALDAVMVPKAGKVEVTSVRPGSPYEQMGVKTSDVIVQLDGAPVTSLTKLVAQMHTRKSLTLEVERDGHVLPLARAETPVQKAAQ